MKPDLTPSPASPTTPIDAAFKIAARFQRYAWDAAGILTLAFTLMTLLALYLPAQTRGLLLLWGGVLRLWLGGGSFLVAVALGIVGLLMLRKGANKPIILPWRHIFALETAAFAGVALLAVIGQASLERAERGLDGGRVGWGLAEILGSTLAPVGLGGLLGRGTILAFIVLVGLIYGLGLTHPIGMRLRKWVFSPQQPTLETEPAVSVAPTASSDSYVTPGGSNRKRPILPPEYRKKFKVEPEEEPIPSRPVQRDDRLPPLELLVTEGSSRPDERSINLTAGMIEKTLAEFGIPTKVVGFKVGPTVTQFAIEPGFVEKPGATEEEEAEKRKVRVAQIAGLQRDLALALAAERLRIEAPVPGRPYVGIEVPNSRSSVVRLRAILETDAFQKLSSPLAIALGRDVSGQPVVADLERMPHLLIAGTTGSGKSVCIAALTACLVMSNTPEDLRLVMIDPKMVELVRFNGLPHLFGKVETNVERIMGVLRWVVAEMDRRYKLLEVMNARHIEVYNRKARRRKGAEILPRIVVMIDELADLMMSAPDQTEPMLVRLAQMARATGIHLVVATQRPSTDVVTGLIKANFPARISFAVASSIDSRVILDTGGAETLLGHGDMLFMPPDVSGAIRSQGVMVTDAEIEKVITFWQHAHPPAPAALPPWEKMLAEEQVTCDRDNLIEKAITLVRQEQRCSASMLQRRLRIGYPRAARLVEELEDLGIVGAAVGGGKDREVLVGSDEIETEEE